MHHAKSSFLTLDRLPSLVDFPKVCLAVCEEVEAADALCHMSMQVDAAAVGSRNVVMFMVFFSRLVADSVW